jgi:hypothetical protein
MPKAKPTTETQKHGEKNRGIARDDDIADNRKTEGIVAK